MKSQAALLLAASGLLSLHAAALPTQSRSASGACHSFGKPGLMKLIDYDAQTTNGTVLAEGTLSVVDNASGNQDLNVQFAECDFSFMGFTSGTSRNHGGSNGAPLEYFGHVVQQQQSSGDDASAYCLTATGGEVNNVDMRFAPCVYGDTAEQLQQWFTYQIDATGHHQLAYVGKKNSTAHVYEGAQSWIAAPKRQNSAFPRVLQATSVEEARYSLRIQSPSA